jgi:hypothetical protein
MSIFVDTFTDVATTLLSAHTPSGGSGGPWVKHPDISGGTGVLQIDTAGTALISLTANSTTNQALYQASTVALGSGDYELICGWRCKSVAATTVPFFVARLGKAGGDRDGYGLRATVAADGGTTWQLYKLDTAAGTTLVGSYAEAAPGGWVVGSIRQATLRLVGSTVSMILDGTTQISYTDPSPVTRTGYPGIMGIANQSQSTGYHAASLTVNDLTPLTPVNTVAPTLTITALPRAGTTVTCSQGTWSNAVSYAYQWKRDGSSIGGATASTYVLQSADLNTLVTCTVTATNASGSTAVTSNPVTPRAGARVPGSARSWPVPDWQRTLLLIGDTHIGNNPSYRYTKFRNGAIRTGVLQPRAAASVHIGDIVEGEVGSASPLLYPDQDAIAIPWLATFTDTPVILMEGNHDSGTRTGGAPDRTTAEWQTAYGVLANDYVDLPAFRFIKVSYQSFDQDSKAWTKSVINAANRPCILGIHYPMRDTIGGGTSPHNNLGSTKSPTFDLCLTSGNNSGVLEVISECPDLKAIVTGHCHAWYDSDDFVCKVTSGANSVAHVNCSAITYVGIAMDEMSDPLIGYYVTLNGDETSVSVRMRDHGANLWRHWPDRTLAKTVAGL